MPKYKLNQQQKRMASAMMRAAKKAGLEVITKTIHFPNNDVPEFLKRLDRFERDSLNVRIMVSSYILQTNYAA